LKKNYSLFTGAIFFSICLFVLVNLGLSESALNESFVNAVDKSNYQLMKDLLAQGADINSSFLEGKYTALSSAASTGNLKLVKFLIDNGADIRGNKLFPNSPVYLAISGNHLEVVSFLLDKGINPNFAWPSKDGGTLLISAIQFGHKIIVKLLVERGADVNFIGNGDHSPLYRSIIYDRFEIFDFLLKQGAKLNDNDKETLNEFKWESIKDNNKYVQRLNK
jgi:ankyrin repeat protein